MALFIYYIFYSAQINSEKPHVDSEMTDMKKNAAYAIHHHKKDFPFQQKDGIYDYDYMN